MRARKGKRFRFGNPGCSLDLYVQNQAIAWKTFDSRRRAAVGLPRAINGRRSSLLPKRPLPRPPKRLPEVRMRFSIAERPHEAVWVGALLHLSAQLSVQMSARSVHVAQHPPAGGRHRDGLKPVTSIEAAVRVAIKRTVVRGHALGPVGF